MWFKTYRLFAAILPVILYKPVYGDASGATLLKIPVGARAIAMGEAYTALADDNSSLYWNPAGIALLNQSQASFMYNRFFDDLTFHHASVGTPLEHGGLGASLSYLSYGQIDAFDANGDAAGHVDAHSAVGTLGGGWLGDNWSAGATVKGIQEKLDSVTASGFATDTGFTFVHPKEVAGGTLRLGAAVRNLGSRMTFLSQSDPLPWEWRVGVAAVQMMKRRLTLSADYGRRRTEGGALYGGLEYWPCPFVALRTGYAGTEPEGSGLRAGVGLKFKAISFDYALSRYGDLGYSHRYRLTVRFGVMRPRLTPEERALLKRAKLAMAEKRYGEATQLFDALLQLVPDYRPAQRLVKTTMAHYESEERAETAPMSAALRPSKAKTLEETGELKDLESLLSAGDQNIAHSNGGSAQRRSEETAQ